MSMLAHEDLSVTLPATRFTNTATTIAIAINPVLNTPVEIVALDTFHLLFCID